MKYWLENRQTLARLISTGLVVFVSSLAWAGRESDYVTLQPQSHSSSIGAFTLFVDPVDQYGNGGAKYRFTKDGKDVWTGERPYTLRRVTVSDEGFVTGFAYRRIETLPEGHSRDDEYFLHIVILSPLGKELRNEVIERQPFPFSSTPPVPPQPTIEQFLTDPTNDRMVVRAWDHRMKWWVYRISTGEKTSELDEKSVFENSDRLYSVVDVQPIRSTSLLLVHGLIKTPDFKVKDEGGRFSVVDEKFKPIWSFETPNDYGSLELFQYSFMGVGPEAYFAKHPGIQMSGEAGQFAIRVFVESKLVKFAAHLDATGNYKVVESGRVELDVEGEAAKQKEVRAAALDGLPELPYLGEVNLVGDAPEPSKLRGIAGFNIGPDGKMYAVARDTGVVHVFDANGLFVRRCKPDPTEIAGSILGAFVAVNDDGVIYVSKPRKQPYRTSDEYFRFSANGEALENVTFLPDHEPHPWSFQPGTGYRCGPCGFRGNGRFVIVDKDGTLIREERRRPNGQWFSGRLAFAMRGDGSMAMLNSDVRQNVHSVDLFSREGAPLVTLPIPSPNEKWACIALGEKIVVVGDREVLIMNLEGTESQKFRIAAWDSSTSLPRVPIEQHTPSSGAFVIADGRELLLYSPSLGKIHRYALPR